MGLGQREGREAPWVTPTPLTLTQNVLISALLEGLLHIPQSPAVMLPPPLGSHSPWDVYWPGTDRTAITGVRSCVPIGLEFLKGGAMPNSGPEGKGI